VLWRRRDEEIAMLDPVGQRLLAVLAVVAAERLGPDHPCTLACERAARDADPALVAAAQDELRRLEPGYVADLMAGAHRSMREDPAAILAQWRGPTGAATH
jgi:hypothetical protein